MAAKKEVTIDSIEKAKKVLFALPKKEPKKMLLEAALAELKPAIEKAIENGYSRAEVIGWLEKQGVSAKLYHLKNLLAKEQKAVVTVVPAKAEK